MKLIDKNTLFKYKTSDTLVIWGCGSSINNLTKNDYDILNTYDSIGFTMFSKTKIPTTFYIIGEIFFNYYRAIDMRQILNGESMSELYDKSGDNPLEYIKTFINYPKTCFLIWNDPWTTHKNHWTKLDKLNNDYFLVNQIGHTNKLKKNIALEKDVVLEIDDISSKYTQKFINKKHYTKDLLLNHKVLLHQWKGINAPIYFAKCMGYKNVIFVGVDLTAGKNSYAFDRNTFIELIASKWHKEHDKSTVHPCKELLFEFINYLKNDINFYTYNENSLLKEIIPIYNKNIIL